MVRKHSYFLILHWTDSRCPNLNHIHLKMLLHFTRLEKYNSSVSKETFTLTSATLSISINYLDKFWIDQKTEKLHKLTTVNCNYFPLFSSPNHILHLIINIFIFHIHHLIINIFIFMTSLYRNYAIIKILFLTVRWSFIFVYVRITLFNGHINLQKTMQIFENVGIHNHII